MCYFEQDLAKHRIQLYKSAANLIIQSIFNLKKKEILRFKIQFLTICLPLFFPFLLKDKIKSHTLIFSPNYDRLVLK